MTEVPILSLSLLQQLTVFTAGLKAGLPAEHLVQTLKDHSEHLPPEAASLLQQMGEDLRFLQEGKAGGINPLLRELTRVVDHQVRNAHNVATASLQAGEMELEGITAVLSAMGDTQGLLALEQARTHLKTAREGLLRGSAFLDALRTIPEISSEAGQDGNQAALRRIADLMHWKPMAPTVPQPVARPPSPSGARASVLYVEDDQDSCDVLTLFLERLDVVEEVHGSSNYSGALQVFSEHPWVSILITDYHLLDSETGLDLARELRRRKPDLKTLFTSGSVGEIEPLLTEEERHEFVLIDKPFALEDLEVRLREAMARNP